MVVMSAIVLVILLGFSALAIDVGFWLHSRTKLQADADSMALAGAQDLCAEASCDPQAEDLAKSYAPLNLVQSGEVSVDIDKTCAGDVSTNHDTITVRTKRNVPTFLAGILGITDTDITACATAKKAAVAGGTGIVPFGIEDVCLAEGEFGASYVLKYDSDPDATSDACGQYGGNFGLLAIDTSGAGSNCGDPPDTAEELKLKRAICFGASRFLCAQGATECTGQADDNNCGSYGKAADDESCTQTGNVSAIKEAINWRFENNDPDCETWEDVTYPTGGLRPECNPWLNSQSKRVIMIPVVHGLFQGSSGEKVIDIVNFAIFYLESMSGCSGSSGNCDVTGRFIQTSLSGSYQGLDDLSQDSSLTVVVLVN
jgi:Putative Flp pilus-assembly TadE/G-like